MRRDLQEVSSKWRSISDRFCMFVMFLCVYRIRAKLVIELACQSECELFFLRKGRGSILNKMRWQHGHHHHRYCTAYI